MDSYCCATAWDGICVGEVSSICKQSCCTPKCDVNKDGKCIKAEAKKCEKDCAQPCCKKPEAKKAA